MKISMRTATPGDLPAILEVEQSWPEAARASADKFMARLEKFPQGFFLACLSEGEEAPKVAATVTAMPLHYDPSHMDQFKTWDRVTNDGYLYDFDLSHCNALYIVSGVIDRRYRGANIFSAGILAQVDLARRLGLRYVLAGAVIPGYQKFCTQHGDVPAFEYCTTRRGSHLVDPLLAMYESIGFSVRNERHVIPEYYPDDASRDYAALVVRELE